MQSKYKFIEVIVGHCCQRDATGKCSHDKLWQCIHDFFSNRAQQECTCFAENSNTKQSKFVLG